MIGPQLRRRVVTLPPDHAIGAAHLQHALGASRALLWRWRRVFGFPAGFRDGREVFTLTDHVEHWLTDHGVEVRRG